MIGVMRELPEIAREDAHGEHELEARPPAAELSRHSQADQQAATEAEIKKHLARELHDRVAQTLTTMVVEMENFKVEQFGRQSVISGLNDLQDSTRDVLNSLRRLLYDLRGEPGVEQDFIGVVRTTLIARLEQRTGIKASVAVSGAWPVRLASQPALNLYRILEEALNNVRQHSRARSVEIAFRTTEDGSAVVTVADDGIGLPASDEARLPGMGTLGMRERALLLGGKLRIENRGVDGGTLVQATFPMEILA